MPRMILLSASLSASCSAWSQGCPFCICCFFAICRYAPPVLYPPAFNAAASVSNEGQVRGTSGNGCADPLASFCIVRNFRSLGPTEDLAYTSARNSLTALRVAAAVAIACTARAKFPTTLIFCVGALARLIANASNPISSEVPVRSIAAEISADLFIVTAPLVLAPMAAPSLSGQPALRNLGTTTDVHELLAAAAAA